MASTRDMTKAEFAAACKRNGFVAKGFLGYFQTPSGVCISALNAGPNRRSQIAYLIRENEKWERQRESQWA